MTGPRPVLDSGLGAGQGIWEVTTAPTLGVGTRGSLEDGRVFYYARNSSTAIVAGQLLQSELVDAQNEDLAVNTAAIGDGSLSIVFGTNTDDANAFAGGYVCVIDDTGEGITYGIESHPAVTSGGTIAVKLKNPVYVAFAAATTVCVIKNPWMDVVVSAAATYVPYAGVSQVAVPLGSTTPQYFWSQTWGVSCAWQEAAPAIGSQVVHAAAAGQVGFVAGAIPAIVGTQLFTGTATEFQPVFLRISQ